MDVRLEVVFFGQGSFLSRSIAFLLCVMLLLGEPSGQAGKQGGVDRL